MYMYIHVNNTVVGYKVKFTYHIHVYTCTLTCTLIVTANIISILPHSHIEHMDVHCTSGLG